MKGLSVLAISFFVIIVGFLVDGCAEEAITLSTEEYPPYTSQKLKHYGIANHIAVKAFALEGIKVKFEFYPAKRAFEAAENGNTDGAVPWVWRKEREQNFYYGEPIMKGGIDGFFHKKDFKFTWNPDNPKYTDLKRIVLGGIRGYNYGPRFMTAEKNKVIKVYRIPRVKQCFDMLFAGRIKLLMLQDVPGYHTLNTSFPTEKLKLIMHTPESSDPKDDEDYFLIISKKSKRGKFFLEAMNRGLRKLKKSGVHRQLLEASNRGEYILEN